MMNIDALLKDIDDLIAGLISMQINGGKFNGNVRPSSLVNISVNITSKSLEDSLSNDIRERLYQNNKERDPLVDVLQTDDKIRVIVTLPGIKPEDVQFYVNPGMLTIEIAKYDQILKKQIRCDLKPGQVTLRSSTVNNSVLELVFDKV